MRWRRSRRETVSRWSSRNAISEAEPLAPLEEGLDRLLPVLAVEVVHGELREVDALEASQVHIDLVGMGHYWISIQDSRFSKGEGEIVDANLTLTLAAEEAAQVFSGEKEAEAAFLSGALKIKGDLPDAMKFHELLEIVLEEIEY